MPLPLSFQQLLAHKNILLLQSPIGFFFDTLARKLQQTGRHVHKIHFNGGDRLFYSASAASYFRGKDSEWSGFLREKLATYNIDAIVLFGQMRNFNIEAREIAKQLGIEVFVFEEGYIRPNYVTLEKDGVNGLSGIPKQVSPHFFWNYESNIKPEKTGQRFHKTAFLAMAYAMASWLARPAYPHYTHHRCMHPILEGLRWVRGGYRKLKYRFTERHILPFLLSAKQSKRWFLVPLQVYNDSQVTAHSQFKNVDEFIDFVMNDFARNAPYGVNLVFKHHPLDKPYSDYSKLINTLKEQLGLHNRVFYIHDQHMPTLLKHTRGIITINSTSGLQALYHRVPVKTLGECCYDVPALTYQKELKNFWVDPGVVNYWLYQRFRAYMIEHTQLNASFYAKAPALEHIGAVQAYTVPSDAPQKTVMIKIISTLILESVFIFGLLLEQGFNMNANLLLWH